MTEPVALPRCSPSHGYNTPSSRTSREHSSSVESAPSSLRTSQWTREYQSDASIALIGIRGTGLSTLAVIAASFLNYKLLDADHHFYQVTGSSRAKYRSEYGHTQYSHAETALLRSMLSEHPLKTIIVCGPGAVEPSGRTSLAEFALEHPVIHVTRDTQGVRDHLRVSDADIVSEIQQASASVLRSISNFEYYNRTRVVDASEQGSHNPLALKQVEKDFLHFIRSINSRCKAGYQSRLTYGLIIPLPVSDTYWINISKEDVLADAIELLISPSAIGSQRSGFDGLAADYITRQYYAAKSSTHLPIILNIRLDDYNLDPSDHVQEYYLDALYHCLRLAPDYLCIDLQQDSKTIRQLTAVKGRTRIIAVWDEYKSHRDWTSPIWSERVYLAESVGTDAVRLRQEATTIADNFAVLYFVNRMNASSDCKIKVIAYNTGQLGRVSQFCGTHLNPVVDPRLPNGTASGSCASLLTIQQSHNALYTSYILGALCFGIYGTNVARSLSPAMHNAAFQRSGMPHVYKVFQNSTLQGIEDLMSDPRLGGLSVTAPFKSQVLSLVDKMSPEASIIGAVNTLIPLRSDKVAAAGRQRARHSVALYGDNTDWIGITNCVVNNLSPINAIKRRTTALVVGAGGMARAATYALARLGVQNIFINNRSPGKAEALAEHFTKCGVLRYVATARKSSPEAIANHEAMTSAISILTAKTDYWPEGFDLPTIIVSCIATKELNGVCSVDTSLPSLWLGSSTGGVVLELSYHPPETPLLKQIRSLEDRGWVAVDGLQMLPEQAKRQFELFTSRPAPLKVMREAVFKALKEKGNSAPDIAYATRTGDI